MIKNQKLSEILLITSLTLITILSGVDGFMYLPAFPEMIKYFKVDPNDITFVSRLELIGLGAGCLFVGTLSLAYGKKKILLCGLLLFLIAVLTAGLSSNFFVLIIACLFIGLAKSAPTVICATIIVDNFEAHVANKKLLILRIFSLPALILAPTLAGYIAHNFGWRFNFFAVASIVILSFSTAIFFIKNEDKNITNKSFSLIEMYRQYKLLITNFRYMANAFIMVFPSTIMTMYMNNVSVIYISADNSLVERFGIYGSILMGITMLFSYISIKIAEVKGLDYITRIGFITAIVSSTGTVIFIILENVFGQLDILQLFGSLSLILCVAGMSMMNGYFIKATEAAPEMKALAVSFILTLNNILDSRGIFWSSIFYDSTLIPTGVITAILIILALYVNIRLNKKPSLMTQ